MSVMQTENVKPHKTYGKNHKNDSLGLPDKGPAVSTLRVAKLESCYLEENSGAEIEIDNQSTISYKVYNISDSTSMAYSNTNANQAKTEVFKQNLKASNSIEKQSKQKLQQFVKLLTQTQFCGLCLDIGKLHYSINNYIVFDKTDNQSKICIKDMLENLLKNSVSTLLPETYICQSCLKKLISSYMFVKNIERKAQQFNDYIQQINEQIDNVETSLGDGNIKNYAHTVIILHENDNASEKINFETCRGNAVLPDSIDIGNETKEMKSTEPKNKTKKMPTYCTECQSFNCKHIKYIDHLKKQKESYNLTTCLSCHCLIKDIPSLLTHVNKLHLNETNTRESSGKESYSNKSSEINAKKEKNALYNCQKCHEKLTLQLLNNHKLSCKGVKRYRCVNCSLTFSSIWDLNSHQLKTHSTHNTQLKTHSTHNTQLKTHSTHNTCDKCNKIFKGKRELNIHFKLAHTKPKNKKFFHCSICNDSFLKSAEKQAHMQTHDPLETSKCIVCKITLESHSQYVKHIHSNQHIINASGKKKHPCSYCEYSTTMKDSLEAHLNRYHLGQATFECSKCPRKFFGQLKLKEHEKTHGAKTHYCVICDKYLCNASALKKHNRRHTGDEPYNCELCEESFLSSTLKKLHMAKEHSQKNIKCPLCDHMFHFRFEMRAHFKRHHWSGDKKDFDINKVPGLKESDYELFVDKRNITL